MNIRTVTFKRIQRPFRVTFATAHGARAHLTSLIVTVTLSDGSSGEGEVPTSLSRPRETVDASRGVLTEAARHLSGASLDKAQEGLDALRTRFPDAVMALAGLETALLRARLAASGNTEHAYWGAASNTLSTDITIPLTEDAAGIHQWLGYAARQGFSVYKVKLGGDSTVDERRLAAVRDGLEQSGFVYALRVDGNQGFTERDAARIIAFIERERIPVECIEQPLAKTDLEGSARLRRATTIPIILDESVATADDLEMALEHGACDGVNIKIAKSGIEGSARLVAFARTHGLKLMIGCMMETWVGVSAAVYLAAGTAVFDYVDLDATHFLFGRKAWGNIRLDGPAITIL